MKKHITKRILSLIIAAATLLAAMPTAATATATAAQSSSVIAQEIDFHVTDYQRVSVDYWQAHEGIDPMVARSFDELRDIVEKNENREWSPPLEDFYGTAFFAERALLILYNTQPSGTPRPIVDTLVRRGNTMTANFITGWGSHDRMGTDDMAYWRIVLSVSHADLNGVVEFKAANAGTAMFNTIDDFSIWFQEWLTAGSAVSKALDFRVADYRTIDLSHQHPLVSYNKTEFRAVYSYAQLQGIIGHAERCIVFGSTFSGGELGCDCEHHLSSFPDNIDRDFFNDKAVVVIYMTVSRGGRPVIDSLTNKRGTLHVSTTNGYLSDWRGAPTSVIHRFVLAIDIDDLSRTERLCNLEQPLLFFAGLQGDVDTWFNDWLRSKSGTVPFKLNKVANGNWRNGNQGAHLAQSYADLEVIASMIGVYEWGEGGERTADSFGVTEDFFDDNVLIVVKGCTAGGSTQTFNSVTLEGDKLIVNMTLVPYRMIPAWEATWVYTLQVSKSHIDGVTNAVLRTTIPQVTISFYSNNALVEKRNVNINSHVDIRTFPTPPPLDGYIFAGWVDTFSWELNGAHRDFDIHARWIPGPYVEPSRVVFDLNAQYLDFMQLIKYIPQETTDLNIFGNTFYTLDWLLPLRDLPNLKQINLIDNRVVCRFKAAEFQKRHSSYFDVNISADFCMNCDCPHRLGYVLGYDVITAADALEILKYIVGIDGVIVNGNRAFRAALITGGETPRTADALEILKHLVGMESLVAA